MTTATATQIKARQRFVDKVEVVKPYIFPVAGTIVFGAAGALNFILSGIMFTAGAGVIGFLCGIIYAGFGVICFSVIPMLWVDV